MRKNEMIFKKIRNIVILIMVMVVAIGAYNNIKNSRAEEKTEVSLLLQDKENIVSTVKLDIEAVKNKNGTYTVNIPKILKSKYVKTYYRSDNKSIDVNTSNTDENITLTLDLIREKFEYIASLREDNKKES